MSAHAASHPAAGPSARRAPGPIRAIIAAIRNASAILAAAAIVAMALIMLTEAIMRYGFSNPLGWNVSAIERILMPMSVFLALPWLYITAGHVSAEIIYDRFSARWRRVARIVGHLLLLLTAAALTYAGMITVVDAFVLGDAPPPGSSEVPIPSWIWQLSQPVGAAALFLVAVLDTPRAIAEEGALDPEVDEDIAVASLHPPTGTQGPAEAQQGPAGAQGPGEAQGSAETQPPAQTQPPAETTDPEHDPERAPERPNREGGERR